MSLLLLSIKFLTLCTRVDVNECEASTGAPKCPDGQKCVNFHGKYACMHKSRESAKTYVLHLSKHYNLLKWHLFLRYALQFLPSTLISTVYPPSEVTLHSFGKLHYIRQFNSVICTNLRSVGEFHFPFTGDVAMSRNECDYGLPQHCMTLL